MFFNPNVRDVALFISAMIGVLLFPLVAECDADDAVTVNGKIAARRRDSDSLVEDRLVARYFADALGECGVTFDSPRPSVLSFEVVYSISKEKSVRSRGWSYTLYVWDTQTQILLGKSRGHQRSLRFDPTVHDANELFPFIIDVDHGQPRLGLAERKSWESKVGRSYVGGVIRDKAIRVWLPQLDESRSRRGNPNFSRHLIGTVNNAGGYVVRNRDAADVMIRHAVTIKKNRSRYARDGQILGPKTRVLPGYTVTVSIDVTPMRWRGKKERFIVLVETPSKVVDRGASTDTRDSTIDRMSSSLDRGVKDLSDHFNKLEASAYRR